MTVPERVVFDCNVFFQALISPKGPARKLFRYATQGIFSLYVSPLILEEFHDVTTRPELRQKYQLSESATEAFIEEIVRISKTIDQVPHGFDLPRDPDDAHYINLAVAAKAQLIVSRDKDLLSLRDLATKEGQQFALQFPDLRILTPPELLQLIAAD